ncbi:MAG: LemA family protein [Methanomicrobiales archaeon]|nr:LemA family protein [Methanomicrobiales archaeon]
MDLLTIIGIIIVLIIIVGFIALYISIYNRFFTLKNSADATLGQIKVAMKKRLDMIEQLLGAVKSYAKFERETFEKVTSLRASVLKAGTGPEEVAQVERESRALLGTLFAVAEAYPDLKTSTTVTNLMESVKTVEAEIARQRYTYNNICQQFNIMLETIPSNFIGRMIGLGKLIYLEFEAEIQQPPKIEF